MNDEVTISEIQAEMCKVVCAGFVNLKEGTPRKALLLKFKSVEALNELIRRGILRSTGNPEVCTPSIAAFELAGNSDLLTRAKEATTVALKSLKSLYEIEPENNFTMDHVLEHARKIYKAVDDEALRLGVYLCQDFRVFRGFAGSQNGIRILNFQIDEAIIEMQDVETLWRKESDRYLGSKSEETVGFTPATPVETFAPLGTFQPCTIDWNQLHPAVIKIARTRYDSGHFADSVEAAMKAVNERVREAVKTRTGRELDGAPLMQHAFSLDKPILILGDLATMTGRSMQTGYLQIFTGAMIGIRNPKAHGNIEIDSVRAVHFLFLASLLMHKLDEAEGVAQTQAVAALVAPVIP